MPTAFGFGSGETFSTFVTDSEAEAKALRRAEQRAERHRRSTDRESEGPSEGPSDVETQVIITARRDGIEDPAESARMTASQFAAQVGSPRGLNIFERGVAFFSSLDQQPTAQEESKFATSIRTQERTEREFGEFIDRPIKRRKERFGELFLSLIHI